MMFTRQQRCKTSTQEKTGTRCVVSNNQKVVRQENNLIQVEKLDSGDLKRCKKIKGDGETVNELSRVHSKFSQKQEYSV